MHNKSPVSIRPNRASESAARRCLSAPALIALLPILSLVLLTGTARAQNVYDYFGGLRYDSSVPTPASVLGYEVGEQFTRHSDLVAYLTSLAEASDRVQMQRYGMSHQRRPLHILTISSPENLADLDCILSRNLELADPRNTSAARADEIVESNPAVVWLSYNVHGNEPSPAETAIQVAYTLAAGKNPEITDILEKLVVVIDPMINPDGHERYVSWLHNVSGSRIDANPDAAEHHEPWPGGRTNHYLFDLNRDWVWMTQPESLARVAIYRQYLPQLHVDYHEQGYTSPYFFGAGDSPYNAHIPAETREWTEIYGQANAEVFDRHGLLYSSRERFDYLYPGYGKVLPCYHGAVGLLCEKAGHSRGGLAIEVSDTYTLTLEIRTRDHYLTSMSYLETTAARRSEQLERFARYFRSAMEVPSGAEHAFVLSGRIDPALKAEVWNLCSGHGIEIDELTEAATIAGLYSYRTGDEIDDDLTIPAGSWVIRADQPKGYLARALFERETFVEERETYDITGWSVPVVFGTEAWYSMRPLERLSLRRVESLALPRGELSGTGSVALLIDSASFAFPGLATTFLEHDVRARIAAEPFEVDDRSFARGSLIVHLSRNEHVDIEALIASVRDLGLQVHRASRGMTTAGPVLGANANRTFKLPRIGLIRSESSSSLSFGQHWHLLDRFGDVPHSILHEDTLGRLDLEKFNVLVVPDGGAPDNNDRIAEWVRNGGTLVATGRAAHWAGEAIADLESDTEDDDESEDNKRSDLTYEERRAQADDDRLAGALIGVTLDTTHPLGSGAPAWMGVVKRNARWLPVSDSGYVIARFASDDTRIGGIISEEDVERIAGKPCMTLHRVGAGRLICLADDPTVRAFQLAPMRLLLNAIIFGGSSG